MTGFAVEPLRGVIAPILTPFNDDLSVAHDLYVEHALKLLSEGCVGLTPFGTTGEAPSIASAERANALWHLTQAGIDAQKMIPGTGLLSVQETADLSRTCMDMGCRGVMVVPPFYYKNVPEDGLFEYYSRVVETVGDGLRLYLYNIPQVAGVGLSISLVKRLHESFPEQIVGIKDSSGDVDYAKALMRIDGLIVYLGSEVMLADAVPLGAQGTITAAANLNAPMIAEYVQGLMEQDAVGVAYLHDGVSQARAAMKSRDFIATPKRALALRTGDHRWANVRPPLIPAPAKAAESLETELKALM